MNREETVKEIEEFVKAKLTRDIRCASKSIGDFNIYIGYEPVSSLYKVCKEDGISVKSFENCSDAWDYFDSY